MFEIFLNQRKQAKLQWIQDPRKSNVDNLNNVRIDSSRHCRKKIKAYLKAKIEELETDSRIQDISDLYRGIIRVDTKKGYQPRSNIVKDEKGDLVADSHCILARCRKYVSLLFKVQGVIDVRKRKQREEPIEPKPSASDFELAVEKLQIHKSNVLMNCLRSGRIRSLFP